MPPLPTYCCCILESPDGHLLLERRPPTAARAPGWLTCFGGTREPDEDPDACIRRELDEELGWQPLELSRALVLTRADQPLAWFYRATAPSRDTVLRTEPGHEAVWLPRHALADAPLSPWHRVALTAYFAGEETAEAEC